MTTLGDEVKAIAERARAEIAAKLDLPVDKVTLAPSVKSLTIAEFARLAEGEPWASGIQDMWLARGPGFILSLPAVEVPATPKLPTWAEWLAQREAGAK